MESRICTQGKEHTVTSAHEREVGDSWIGKGGGVVEMIARPAGVGGAPQAGPRVELGVADGP